MSAHSENKPRLAVVGGGISGLTATFRLRTLVPNAEVELFEAASRLGGVLSTRREDDLLIEQGADSFLNKLPHALDLCKELGIEDRLVPTNEQHRRALVWHGGALHPVPQGFVVMRPSSMWSMLTTGLLSWQGRLRILAEPFLPPPRDIHQDDFDLSVAEFASQRLGGEAFERLVQPLLAGIYTADATKLSLASTMPEAITALREHRSLYRAAVKQSKAMSTDSGARYASFVTPRNGLREIIDALAERIGMERIRLNSSVQMIQRKESGRWEVHGPDGAIREYDGVIIALPAPRTAEVLRSLDATLAEELSAVEYASSAVVCLTYDQSSLARPIDGFGIVVPDVSRRPIVAASFSSMKFPQRAPIGQLLVRVFLGGALRPEQMSLDDDALIKIATEEMCQMIGAPTSPLTRSVVRWNEKMPQYHVGHAQRIQRIEDRVDEHPGLQLAGNAYHGVGIPQCVRSGDLAARRLISGLRITETGS